MEKKESLILRTLLTLVFFQAVIFNPWGEDVFTLSKFLFSSVIIFTAFLLFLLKKLEEDKIYLSISFFDIPVLIYFITLTISTILSVHKPTSIREFLLNFNYVIFYFLLVNSFHTISDLKKIIYFIFFTSAVISIYSILQRMKIDFFYWSDATVHLRPASTLGNPNFLSAYLCIVLPLLITRIILKKEEKIYKTIFYFFTSCILFLSLLFTYTRGGWLSFSLAFLGLILLKRNFINKKKFLTLILFFLIIFCLNSQQRIPIEDREFNLLERATSISPSVFVRLTLWKDSLFLFKKYFFLGSGLNTFPFIYPLHRSVEILKIQAITALPEDAHNQFLQTAVTMGIIGFFSYLFLLLSLLLKLFTVNKSDNSWITAGLFSAFLAYLIQSIFNPIVPDTKLLFFGILGFTALYQKIYNKRKEFIINNNIPLTFKIFLYISISLTLMFLVLPPISSNFVGDYNFKKGRYFERTGRLDLAVKYYLLSTENNPKNPSYHRQSGFIYRKIAEIPNLPKEKKKYFLEESIKEYQETINLNTYDASAYADLAKVYSYYATLDKKFYKKAIECYEISIKKDYNYSIFHNDSGIVYLNMGKYEEAEKEFKIARGLTPNFIDPYLNLGILYYRKKEYNKAIKVTQEAIKNGLESNELYANLGIFYKEKKEYYKAKKMIEKAVKLDPENLPIKKLLKEIEEEWKKNSKK